MKIKPFLLVIAFVSTCFVSAQSPNLLWFDKPASYFEESFLMGNGKMGASIFGGIESDKIYLNDLTFWSGGPVGQNLKPEAYKNLPAIREALKMGNYRLAEKLQGQLQGPYSESYQPIGTLQLDFGNQGQASAYYRELNVNDAISKVRYEEDGVTYTREYFVSNPAKVMVIRLTASKKGALDFGLRFQSPIRHQISFSKNMLKARGQAPAHVEPDYLGNVPNAVVYAENKGTRFSTLVKIKNMDGSVNISDSSLIVRNGTEVLVFVSIATSFNGFDKDPVTQGLNDQKLALNQLNIAFGKTYYELKKEHLNDFRHYSERVQLELGKTTAPNLPTDQRLKRYAEGLEDKNLEILYFRYGRYLLISSSRTPGVPANLQGLWNPYVRPPWSCNYTVNINVEENYWPAETANLSEMHLPLMQFIKNVSKTGTATAANYYGLNGWTACHNSDIWAMSNPVSGHPMWANWNMGGPWLATHLWEHYAFTMDQSFLEKEAYPLMRGVARFCLDWMVDDSTGQRITSPSTSPENLYQAPDGFQGATMYGGTADLAIIRELLTQTLKASNILKEDPAFVMEIEKALSRMRPYQIGSKGNLQEWYFDWEDADPKHRHQSHLFGLYPGHQITPATAPALANACRKSLEIKGDETTGWSKGWRINLWARLMDGNHAYKMYRELLRYVDPDGVRTNYSNGGGTYPNLCDAHPPFQIDGNFGGTAAVVEMLMQSSDSEIRLLPALPLAWPTGSVSGLCARGGFEVSMTWKNGALQEATVSAKQDGKTCLVYGNLRLDISLKKGKQITHDYKMLSNTNI